MSPHPCSQVAVEPLGLLHPRLRGSPPEQLGTVCGRSMGRHRHLDLEGELSEADDGVARYRKTCGFGKAGEPPQVQRRGGHRREEETIP